jgi:hypothetical protein
VGVLIMDVITKTLAIVMWGLMVTFVVLNLAVGCESWNDTQCITVKQFGKMLLLQKVD